MNGDMLIANASLDGQNPWVRIAPRDDHPNRIRFGDHEFRTVPLEILEIHYPEPRTSRVEPEKSVAFAGKVMIDGAHHVVIGEHFRSRRLFGLLDIVG